MNTTNAADSTNFTYTLPESRMSKVIKWMLTLMRMNKRMEKHLRTGKINQQAAAVPPAFAPQFNLTTTVLNGRKIWTIQPKQGASEQSILYLHGGAYIYNISKQHWTFIEALIQATQATVIIADYPLAPQATCDDVFTFMQIVYKHVLTTTASNTLSIMGDSAGGGLALAFTQFLRDEQQPLPKQLILLSPWLDGSMSNPALAALVPKDKILTIKGLHLAAAAYAGERNIQDYRVSPLYGNLDDLPPIALFTSTHDLLFADAQQLKHQLAALKTPLFYAEYPRMIHCWPLIIQLQEAQEALKQIVDLVNNSEIEKE